MWGENGNRNKNTVIEHVSNVLPKYAFFCLDMNNKENEEVVNKLNSINELFEKGEYPSKNPYLIKYNKDLCSIFENKLLL